MRPVFFHTLVLLAFASRAQSPADALTASPNPFTKRTQASYTITGNDTVSLNLVNLLGKEIFTFKTNLILPPGSYQDSVRLDTFPDGIYFLSLKLGKRKQLLSKLIKSNSAGLVHNDPLSFPAIFPNPSAGKFAVLLPTGSGRLVMRDMAGRACATWPVTGTLQAVEATLPGGMYFLFHYQGNTIVGFYKVAINP